MVDKLRSQQKRILGHTLRKVVLWIVGTVAALVVLIWVADRVSAYDDFKRDLMSYQEIKLNDSMEEVNYALGYPPHVLGPVSCNGEFEGCWQPVFKTDGTDPKNALPAGKKPADYFDWQYQKPDRRIDISFDSTTKQVSQIGCYVNNDLTTGAQYCSMLFGIDSDSMESDVLRKLGKPDANKFEGSTKSLRYDELGLDVTMAQRHVYMLKKHAPEGAGLWWFLSHSLF